MQIISIKEISTKERLNQKIDSLHMSKKAFVKDFNIWLKSKKENGEYIEEPELTEKDLARWTTTKGKSVNMRLNKIKMFADYFNVDVEYLNCTQIDEHKSKLPQIQIDRKEIEKYEFLNLLIPILNLYTFDIVPCDFESNEETIEYIDNKRIITCVDNVKGSILTYKIIFPDGTIKIFKSEDISDFIDKLSNYMKFLLHELKDNNSRND